jgi:hypothetical protein
MKLNILMDDIKKRNFFGHVNAAVYTIEFQKRGLPHAHIIVWLKRIDLGMQQWLTLSSQLNYQTQQMIR